MTVQATPAAVRYSGDGVTRAFLLPFEMRASGDLAVFFDGVEQGVNYLLSGTVTQPGSTLTFMVAPELGVDILIARATPLSQDTVYTAHGPYKAEQHEADFDRAMLIAQESAYRIANPRSLTAEQVRFDNAGTNYTSENVQDALEEVDDDMRASDAAIIAAFQNADELRALKTTRVISDDPEVLAVLQATLANDVRLVPITNVANGMLKLDATGRIPPELIQAAGLAFLGTWSPSVDGPTPPAGITHGDMYIFDGDGTMTLAESTNTTPHDVTVFINDYMVYDGVLANWYYVHAAQAAIITASGVLFVPVGTLGSTNVQNAIAELDASISQRFKEQGDEIVLYRMGAVGLEPVLISSSDGVRLIRNNQDKLQTIASGIALLGANLGGSAAQSSSVIFRTLDGQTLGGVGWLGDGTLYLISYRPGAPMSHVVTNAANVLQSVLQGLPDGPTTIFERGRQRIRAGTSQMILYSDDTIATAAPAAQLSALSADGATMWRTGFLGSVDYYTAVDKAGANWRVQLAGAALGNMVLTATIFATGGDIQAGGQVIAQAPAPISPSHLTRKDYVDSMVAGGFTSADLPINPGALGVDHNLGQVPTVFGAHFVCVAPQAGYVVGDVIPAPGCEAGTGYGVMANATQVGFLRAGPGAIIPTSGGAPVSMIEANWRLRLYARR